MHFNIETEVVKGELDKIEKNIDKLRTILTNLESNISSGWQSARATGVVTPKIDEIKTSIDKMQECTNNVRTNVLQYVSNVTQADEAGTLTGKGE